MKRKFTHNIKIFLTLIFLAAATGVSAQNPQLRTSERQVRTVLDRIALKTSMLQRDVSRSRVFGNTNTADERVADLLISFDTAVKSLRQNTSLRGDTTTDFNEILSNASRISRIIDRNNSDQRITSQWVAIRGDVNTLAGYYGLSWNSSMPYPPTNGGWENNNGGRGNNNGTNNNGGWNNGGRVDFRLNGTYRLNASQSDNVNDVIERSIGSYGNDQRDNVRRNLERRLRSPEMIAFDKNGRSITLASSNQPQVTFDADGVPRTETNARGRTITTTVSTVGNDLNIKYVGDRTNDFDVTFSIDRNGRLRVTRRIYLENRNDQVTVSSVYDRISPTADWSQVTVTNDNYGGNNNNTNNNRGSSGSFYIPNGVRLTATLRSTVNTKASQAGDRFTMEVTSPNQYRGAMIEGRVSQAANSGRVSGRANISLDFDTITMNGQRYAFAGIIESVTAANGDSVTVNNEGTIRDNSQTNKTATRAGIGAVLGAVIGAVAGGGSGAAIGAGVGAGAGAGSVLIAGRDSIELGNGSTFTITSSAPGNASYVRN